MHVLYYVSCMYYTMYHAYSTRLTIIPSRQYRWMYWTDWGSSPRIERASMDGTSRSTLHNTGLQWPNGLTLDLTTQILYWADAGNLYDRIESSRVDGSNRRVLTTTHVYHPFGIDIFRGVLYRTDWAAKAVLNASVAQPSTVGVVISRLLLDPMGIRVVSMEKQPIGMQLCMEYGNTVREWPVSLLYEFSVIILGIQSKTQEWKMQTKL